MEADFPRQGARASFCVASACAIAWPLLWGGGVISAFLGLLFLMAWPAVMLLTKLARIMEELAKEFPREVIAHCMGMGFAFIGLSVALMLIIAFSPLEKEIIGAPGVLLLLRTFVLAGSSSLIVTGYLLAKLVRLQWYEGGTAAQ